MTFQSVGSGELLVAEKVLFDTCDSVKSPASVFLAFGIFFANVSRHQQKFSTESSELSRLIPRLTMPVLLV
jgi:hypothetical protein